MGRIERIEKNLEFIEFYKEREELWNMRFPLYKSKHAKLNAYKEIAKSAQMSVEQVKKKIKSIRTVYAAEKSKVEAQKSAGSEYVPVLAWFSQMSFLDDCIRRKKVRNNSKDGDLDESMLENSVLTKVTSPSKKAKKKRAAPTLVKRIEKNLEFIELYKKREELWNMQSPLYKRKDAKLKAYKKIARSAQMSVEQVKKKIKIIRTVYAAEKSKVEAHKCAGWEYIPVLAWYSKMSFLDDCIRRRKIRNNSKDEHLDESLLSEDSVSMKETSLLKETKKIREAPISKKENTDEVKVQDSKLLGEDTCDDSTNTIMDEFLLDEGESYAMRCGDIYFTTIGRLVFHCTLCEMKFPGFELYKLHVNDHKGILFAEEYCDGDEEYFSENEVDLIPSIEDNNGHMDEWDPIEELEEETSIFEDEDISSINRCKSPSGKKFCNRSKKYLDDYVTEDFDECVEDNIQVVNLPNSYPIAISATNNTNDDEYVAPAKNKISPDKKQRNKRNFKQISSKETESPEIKFEAVREVEKRPLSKLTSDEERIHKCPVCGLGFKERHNMRHHLQRHSNKKDHNCSVCGKAFYTLSELNTHMRVHTKVRPFLCTICGKTYTRSSLLSDHLRKHALERNYKCEVCDKAFYTKDNLKCHMAKHSSEKPFACSICPAAFARRESLRNHSKLHENKKTFKCKLCPASFNQRAGLFGHAKTSHKTT